MKLKRRLPKDRTFEQIKNHYEVEKSIAGNLKSADREKRKTIYPVMYDELFARQGRISNEANEKQRRD